MSTPDDCLDSEADARRVVLLRALETGATDPHRWSDEDRAWADRAARESLAGGRSPSAFVAARASAAAERLRGRLPAAAGWLERRAPFGRWAAAAAAVGLVAGAAVDRIGPAQRVELLASPVWLLLAWNLAVYAALLAQLFGRRGAGGVAQRVVARWLAPAAPAAAAANPLQRAALDWAAFAAPRDGARAAALLHLAAAALGAGLVLGLYARGLVLDFRAGWQSTFIDAATLHALLGALFGPAAALTGIELPGADALAALRVTATQPPQAPAAPWLHLFATTIGLAVVGPRLALAAAAAARAGRLQRRWPLPWHEPYFAVLRGEAGLGRAPVLWLAAADAGVSGAAALAAQALAGPRWECVCADAAPAGSGGGAAPPPAPEGTAAVLLVVDLAATPEDEIHGRCLRALRAAAPVARAAVLADEARFADHAGRWPGRLDQRRQAWRDFAGRHGAALVGIDSRSPGDAAAAAVLRRVLEG